MPSPTFYQVLFASQHWKHSEVKNTLWDHYMELRRGIELYKVHCLCTWKAIFGGSMLSGNWEHKGILLLHQEGWPYGSSLMSEAEPHISGLKKLGSRYNSDTKNQPSVPDFWMLLPQLRLRNTLTNWSFAQSTLKPRNTRGIFRRIPMYHILPPVKQGSCHPFCWQSPLLRPTNPHQNLFVLK